LQINDNEDKWLETVPDAAQLIHKKYAQKAMQVKIPQNLACCNRLAKG